MSCLISLVGEKSTPKSTRDTTLLKAFLLIAGLFSSNYLIPYVMKQTYHTSITIYDFNLLTTDCD